MDTDTSTLAFRTAIEEIKNACPGISTIFVLDENKQIVARDQNATESLIASANDALTSIMKNTSIVGSINSFTCSSTSQKINFARYENNYFVTFASLEIDEKTIETMARVMVPSILRLAQGVTTSQNGTTSDITQTNNPQSPQPKKTVTQSTPPSMSVVASTRPQLLTTTSLSAQAKSKHQASNLPATEFTVENLSGINIISSDPETIHVDRILIGEWKEIYGDKHIPYATIECSDGKRRVKCKFQSMKNEKFEGHNIVLVPNRIQAKLEIKKGTIVRIRPIVEDEEE